MQKLCLYGYFTCFQIMFENRQTYASKINDDHIYDNALWLSSKSQSLFCNLGYALFSGILYIVVLYNHLVVADRLIKRYLA